MRSRAPPALSARNCSISARRCATGSSSASAFVAQLARPRAIRDRASAVSAVTPSSPASRAASSPAGQRRHVDAAAARPHRLRQPRRRIRHQHHRDTVRRLLQRLQEGVGGIGRHGVGGVDHEDAAPALVGVERGVDLEPPDLADADRGAVLVGVVRHPADAARRDGLDIGVAPPRDAPAGGAVAAGVALPGRARGAVERLRQRRRQLRLAHLRRPRQEQRVRQAPARDHPRQRAGGGAPRHRAPAGRHGTVSSATRSA